MYVTLPDGRKIRIPTDAQDAAIRAAALSDPDCPPMTEAQLARLRPAREVLSPAQYANLTDKTRPAVIRHVTDAEDRARRNRVGRPRVAVPRPRLNMRVDADILERLRATGRGWQTRVNALLREAVQSGRV